MKFCHLLRSSGDDINGSYRVFAADISPFDILMSASVSLRWLWLVAITMRASFTRDRVIAYLTSPKARTEGSQFWATSSAFIFMSLDFEIAVQD